MLSAKRFIWIRKSALILFQLILVFAFGCGPQPTPIIIVLPTATGAAEEVEIPASSTVSPIPPGSAETRVPTITPTPFDPRAIIRIFVHVPLSGQQADLGIDILHGAELAVLQMSGPLNEYSYRVELESYDDRSTMDIALATADVLVTNPEILCGVGHLDPEITISTSNVYHLAGLPFIAPATTAPALTDRNFREVNRLIGRADGQGIAAAQFAAAQGYSSAYIVSQAGENSGKNAEHFRVETGKLRIQWLGTKTTDITDENIDQIVSEIMNIEPDVVYISSSADQAIPFLTELRAAGYTGALLGTEQLDDPAMINLAGASLTQGDGLFYTITSPPAEYYADAATFIEDFTAQYGEPPLDLAARAYDAVGMCLKAVEEASRAKGGTPPTRLEVASALRGLDDYEGITGTYDLNRKGDPEPVEYYIFQVTSVDLAEWNQNPIVASYEIIPP